MSRGNGNNLLPFDVDTALEDEIAAYREQADTESLYPPMKVHQAPPLTAREKRELAHFRSHRTAMRSGPFFVDDDKSGNSDPANFNAFEDVATYSNTMAKRTGGLPNLKKVPIVKEFLPRELWDDVSDNDEETEDTSTKKNVKFLNKKRLDKLARFDEGADAPATGADDAAKDDEDEDDEDRVELPEDDSFSEDDEDQGNDYNGEKYFDNGEADDDGDEPGQGEDAW